MVAVVAAVEERKGQYGGNDGRGEGNEDDGEG